jgi:hypothetical protein
MPLGRLLLLVLLSGGSASRLALRRLGNRRKLSRKTRLLPAGAGEARLLNVEAQIEPYARLVAAVLLILAGIECLLQLAEKLVADFEVAFVVRLIRGTLPVINPKRSPVRPILLLRLLGLVAVHWRTGKGWTGFCMSAIGG